MSRSIEVSRSRTNRAPGSKSENAEEEEEDGVDGLTEGLGMRPEYEFCARDEATLTRLGSMCRKTAIVFVLASAVSVLQMVSENYFAGKCVGLLCVQLEGLLCRPLNHLRLLPSHLNTEILNSLLILHSQST